MAYATRSDIEAVYGQALVDIVADLTNDGIAEDVAIATALEEASSEVDTYVALVLDVPIASPPPVIVQLCRDMAIYRLALQSGQRTKEMRVRYEDALKLLERISTGKAKIPAIQGDTDGDGDVDEEDEATVRPSPYVLKSVRNG